MESTGVFLREDQVIQGMVVALCLEGKTEPEQDGEGRPLVLDALIGGIAKFDLKFYPHPVQPKAVLIGGERRGADHQHRADVGVQP